MINNLEYKKITDDIIAMPHQDNPNYYYLKNKLDETDAIVIGHINYKEDNFYISLKNYIELDSNDLKIIANYMSSLEKVEGDFPEIKEEAPSSKVSNNDLGNLANVLGSIMTPSGGEDVPPMELEENND